MDYPCQELLARRQKEDTFTSHTSQGVTALPPKQCYIPPCPYLTLEGLSFKQQLTDIDAHISYVHSQLTAPAPTAPAPSALPTAPIHTALPRPEVQEDITEEEWGYFKEKWMRYQRSSHSEYTDRQVMYQLWASCSSSLKSRIFRKKK